MYSLCLRLCLDILCLDILCLDILLLCRVRTIEYYVHPSPTSSDYLYSHNKVET